MRHVLIERSRFDGSQQLLDTIKFNQSTWIFLRQDRITGASQNPLQFVAVQHGAVTDSELADGGDWCAYFKGGSADLLIARNRVHDCGTGGLLAGQGSGLQFMVPPLFRYEAYRIVIARNWVWRTQGAGIGVNGGLRVALVDNRLWDTGVASHTVEIDYGLRSCDGHAGDPWRQLCGQYLSRGAWGTTRVDNGSNEVRIPNLDVTVAGNVIANPRVQGDELLDIAAPFSGPDQVGSGLGAVRADRALRIFDNLFAVGRGLPNGTAKCRAADCGRLRRLNTVTAPSHPFINPAAGDLALRRGWRGVPIPGFWRG
ncbi:MAG: right-handed parallel beta-helix repeat-containing protein [Actinomycetota bacterium]|nr:right-handed parallel beta-helix repeat-containing protein [Actinomycetota bacterium]